MLHWVLYRFGWVLALISFSFASTFSCFVCGSTDEMHVDILVFEKLPWVWFGFAVLGDGFPCFDDESFLFLNSELSIHKSMH